VRGFARAEQHDERAARFGGDREPAQFLIPGMAEPSDQGMTRAGAQHLLRRPESIAPARGAHHGEMGEIHARGGQGGRIRQVRRRQPYDALPGRGEPCQRRQDELQLADSLLQPQDLGKRRGRPPAARQLPVELYVTRGNRWGNRRERPAAPDGMPLQEDFEGRHLGGRRR